MFPFSIIGLLVLTRAVHLPWLSRYDWMFVLCVLVQLGLVWRRIETWKDAGVVALFHLLGMGLELYKVNAGSWTYPEEFSLGVGPVPLYAGFMYGSVASFMCLAWKRHGLRASGWPEPIVTLVIAALIYLQFFVPIWTLEVRLLMVLSVAYVFRKATVHFGCIGERWAIPMPAAFALIGAMIYTAENVATSLGAWRYPYQDHGWQMVHPAKMLSWMLLMTVSLIIVAEYKRRLSALVATSQDRDRDLAVTGR